MVKVKTFAIGCLLRITQEQLIRIFHKGKNGEVYNIGGNNEWRNIDLVNFLCHTHG